MGDTDLPEQLTGDMPVSYPPPRKIRRVSTENTDSRQEKITHSEGSVARGQSGDVRDPTQTGEAEGRTAHASRHSDGDKTSVPRTRKASYESRSDRRETVRRRSAIFAVTLASGLLFSVSALVSRQHDIPVDRDLVSLVKQNQERVRELESQNNELREGISALTNEPSGDEQRTIPALSQVPVVGPGVSISLEDAHADFIPDGASPNDLVIHQQDIEDVMNALWAGGAEAMTVQGIRVTGQTVIRCIGNVILVDGTSFSPPYVIEAIGNVNRLMETVNENPRIVNYKNYVALYGLGWDMKAHDSLQFPAASQDVTHQYARVVKDNG